MEEDDVGDPALLIGAPLKPGRTFTLYLYDREKHMVRDG
jgi:hypothetical protein